jgi:hypothetical protein
MVIANAASGDIEKHVGKFIFGHEPSECGGMAKFSTSHSVTDITTLAHYCTGEISRVGGSKRG